MYNWEGASPLPSYFNPPDFLPNHFLENIADPRFSNFDTEKRYRKNLKSQPDDWHYRTKEVLYQTNSKGYRAPEWDKINWGRAVVILGCSNVTGIGLAEDETISHQLSLMLNRPVINLGVPASSIECSFYNSVILAESYPTPYAVVNIWTNTDRAIYFHKNHKEDLGIWTPQNPFFKEFIRDPLHPFMQARFIAMASRQMWKDKSRYFSASFFEDAAHYMQCDYIDIDNGARDLVHPGRKNAIEMASLIAQNIS